MRDNGEREDQSKQKEKKLFIIYTLYSESVVQYHYLK